jgi:hypothetical protein
MTEVLTCPSCQRKLQVPENLLGQDVQCPTCGATFLAQAGGAAPSKTSRQSESRAMERSSRRENNDEDYEDRDRKRVRKRKRHDYEPHRGTLILVLGILSFFVAGPILGPIAWIMGNNDMEAIRSGRMDPEGEGATNAGRICGMVSTIISIVMLAISLVIFCMWFICAVGMCGAAGAGSPPPRRGGGGF